MKIKLAVVLVIILFLAAASAGQEVDFVILLDTSVSMIPIYRDMIDYQIDNLLKSYLEPGDSFHLIAFADKPELVIAAKITKQNINRVITKALLLQPVGKYTDLVRAYQFLYNYLEDLPLNSKKRIIILTDGINDPPPGSVYYSKDKQKQNSETKEKLEKVTEKINQQGWDIKLVETPQGELPTAADQNKTAEQAAGDSYPEPQASSPPPAETNGLHTPAPVPGKEAPPSLTESETEKPESGQTEENYLELMSKDLGSPVVPYDLEDKNFLAKVTQNPMVIFPDKSLGKVGYSFRVPLIIENPQADKIILKLKQIVYNNTNILVKPLRISIQGKSRQKIKPKITIPAATALGENRFTISLGFAEGIRVYPYSGTIRFTLRQPGSVAWFSVLRKIGLGLLVLFLIIFFIALVIYLSRALEKVTANAVTGVKHHALFAGDHRPIEMRVSEQNPYIGIRNIHYLHPKSHKTVGGGTSSFLVFLVPYPTHIGEISYDGTGYTFKPVKKEYFPDLKTPLRDCLGKKIKIISGKGYVSTIVFQEYVSALEEINKLMHQG